MTTKRALTSLFAMIAAVGLAAGAERPASAAIYGPGYVCNVAYTPLLNVQAASGANGLYVVAAPNYQTFGTHQVALQSGSNGELYVEIWTGPSCTGTQIVFGYFYTVGQGGNWTEQGLLALWQSIRSHQEAGRRVQINGAPTAYNNWILDIAVLY